VVDGESVKVEFRVRFCEWSMEGSVEVEFWVLWIVEEGSVDLKLILVILLFVIF